MLLFGRGQTPAPARPIVRIVVRGGRVVLPGGRVSVIVGRLKKRDKMAVVTYIPLKDWCVKRE